MILTTYFARLRNIPENVIPVSICAKAPQWYDGLQYKKLAPKYGFFSEWKKTHDNDYYIEHYNSEVLDALDLYRVLDELQVMLPEEVKEKMQSPIWRNPDWHIVLVCYEKSTDFCHRHLVAKWLMEHGIACNEIRF